MKILEANEQQKKYMKTILEKTKIIIKISYNILTRVYSDVKIDIEYIDGWKESDFWKGIPNNIESLKELEWDLNGIYEELDKEWDLNRSNIFGKLSDDVRNITKRALTLSEATVMIYMKATKARMVKLDKGEFTKNKSHFAVLLILLGIAVKVARVIIVRTFSSKVTLSISALLIGSGFIVGTIFNRFDQKSIDTLDNWINILKKIESSKGKGIKDIIPVVVTNVNNIKKDAKIINTLDKKVKTISEAAKSKKR